MKNLMKTPLKTVKIGAVALIALCFLGMALRKSMLPIELGNDGARDLTAKNILADRDKTIGQLEETVRTSIADPKQAQTTKAAMLLLGQLRADDASPLLVEHLTFFMPDASRFITRIPPMEDLRPQIVALDDIGLPALPSLLAKRMETDDPLVNSLADATLQTILGRQVALAYVQQAIDGQANLTHRRRLIALRDAISRPR